MTSHQTLARHPTRPLTPTRGLRPTWAGVLAAAIAAGSLALPCRAVHASNEASSVPGPFHSQRGTPNLLHDVLKDPEKFWPTPYGPTYANVLTDSDNFLPCQGGPFALCYYSGPEPLGCELSADGRIANCNCLNIDYGVYFVDINAILKHSVYQQTVDVCGTDGSECSGQTNKAPVCDYINRNTLFPGADRVSAFSFDCALEAPIGQTQCSTPAPYAGCMTAPCTTTNQEGVVECQCPVYDGPYQIGQSGQVCELGSDMVWSAAFNPNASGGGGTFPATPPPPACIPDLPEEHGGCPLLQAGAIPPQPGDTVCDPVCGEYQRCTSPEGIEVGFTCDATLCTNTCTNRDLVRDACTGLGTCETGAIIALETAYGCSCCASQICRCPANVETNAAIASLNQEQRDRGLVPQCDLNGTLCGTEP